MIQRVVMRRPLLLWLVGAAFLFAHTAAAKPWFTSENRQVKNGNVKLAAGENGEALALYDEAAAKLPSRGEVHLNRGLAASRMGDEQLDTAMQALKLAVDAGASPQVRARAERNLGDAFFRRNDFAEAIRHYQQSLLQAPGDRDVAWNLELARQKKEEQDAQKDDADNDQDGEPKDDQDPSNDSDDGDEDDADDKNKDSDDGDDGDKQDDGADTDSDDGDEDDADDDADDNDSDDGAQDDREDDGDDDNAPPPEPRDPSAQEMEEALQMLDALEQQDDDLTRNKARMRAVGVPPGAKDW
ncbi:MAG: tetratricopeptide repeat protein [Myxococcales bacterium]|nr:tetratricopeptide repeat protein [Myxococcales bacterium]